MLVTDDGFRELARFRESDPTLLRDVTYTLEETALLVALPAALC